MNEVPPAFSGIARLVGTDGLARLRAARVLIIGIGGVGAWVAEALARSGVGTLTLVDMDELCTTNLNRQVHATLNNVGRPKVEAMAERLQAIAPGITVHAVQAFFTEANADALLDAGHDYVVDAIDSVKHKCLILVGCRSRGIPALTVGGAGGRIDPTRIEVVDLTRTRDDALLQRVRKKLRQNFGFPRNTRKKWKIAAVFSSEPVRYPQADGSVCATREEGSTLRLDCASGYGTASFVTGAFGFAAAARVVQDLALSPRSAPPPPPE